MVYKVGTIIQDFLFGGLIYLFSPIFLNWDLFPGPRRPSKTAGEILAQWEGTQMSVKKCIIRLTEVAKSLYMSPWLEFRNYCDSIVRTQLNKISFMEQGLLNGYRCLRDWNFETIMIQLFVPKPLKYLCSNRGH